ncbi:MAG: hypothetical protein JSS08_07145 [Proteobacteria bacterium]|nr:hypothetical protein [Pseudomonadota bacterium]
MDIMMGLSAIKQTLDITKDLREIDEKVNIADLKLRLSDIVERLLEAREALYDAKERERLLRDEIEKLRGDLDKKARLNDEYGRLYEIDERGTKVGVPYCNLCYVKENKLYRLLPRETDEGLAHICSNCHTFLDPSDGNWHRRSFGDLGRDLA